MSNHWLLVERRGDDDDYIVYPYCDGADSSCIAWMECREEHDDLDSDNELEGESHGMWHEHMMGSWMVETGKCALYAFHDAWYESGTDLAYELGVGRHPITFDWDDEYTILIDKVKQ